MIPKFDKVHQKFKFNSIHYSFEELKEFAYSLVKEGESFEHSVGDFLLDWTNAKSTITVKTSGTTGPPKKIEISKQSMVNSAIMTGDYFNLIPGNSVLHCLPTQFIAGKMMLVRALILGLEMDVVEPTSQPIFDYDKPYDFCAMLPMQLQSTYNYVNNIKTIIVGGAQVSQQLIKEIQHIQTSIYETYSMTETVTHIAVKRINGKKRSELFKVMPNIEISQDERQCLIIKARHLTLETIFTNDVVKMQSDTEFEWIGRHDNVINSGGLKLFPEQIETKLSKVIADRFFIASLPDDKYGERVILIIESETSHLDKDVFKDLNKYEVPKHIYAIPKFEFTSSGKIQREKVLSSLK